MRKIGKRIFYLCLSLFLFTSCTEKTDSPEMLNVVLGVWNNYYGDTDSLVMTRVFNADFYSYFTFSEGKKQDQANKQHYTINETQIMLEKYTQTYVLHKDTLWITNSTGDEVTKYVRTIRNR